jgi:hypothetical protein
VTSIPNDRARSFWAKASLRIWPQSYLLISLPTDFQIKAAQLIGSGAGVFAALLMERDEVSLTVEESLWKASDLRLRARSEHGPYRAITIDVNVDLDVVGFLAPALLALAEAGISIVPQCAYSKDHLLVHERYLKDAVQVLEDLLQSCHEPSSPSNPVV